MCKNTDSLTRATLQIIPRGDYKLRVRLLFRVYTRVRTYFDETPLLKIAVSYRWYFNEKN